MASVNFEKLKGAAATKAMLRHCDKEERLKHEHSNKEIDKRATQSNAQMKRNYKQSCEFYDKRIDELDSTTNTNKRKDRVTCMGLSIPFPEGMNDRQGFEWCKKCLEIVREMYGRQNIVQTYIHYDEKHDYTNAETGKLTTSRSHIHIYVIPEIEGKLNAKVCMNKAHMVELNNRIHQMTEKEYGLQFMDGSKTKSEKSVTSLKSESRRRELDKKEAMLAERAQKLDLREKAIQDKEKTLNSFEEALRASEEGFQTYKTAVDKVKSYLIKQLPRQKDKIEHFFNPEKPLRDNARSRFDKAQSLLDKIKDTEDDNNNYSFS